MVRAATINDIDQLAKLFNSYRMFYGKVDDVEAGKGFLTERFNNKDSEIYVAALETGVLTGFVQLYPLYSSTRLRRLWLLNDLFVAADHRGKGFGIQLIERAKQLVIDTDAAGMYLETEVTNDIGNALYPKTGFEYNDYANFYEWNNPNQ